MNQRDNARPRPRSAQDAGGRAPGDVSWAARSAIAAVTLLGGLLVLGNLVLSLASSIGPDSCDEVSCHGDGVLVKVFLALAATGGVAIVGTWFTARPTRRTARYVLSFVALGVPLIGDLMAISSAPDWLV
jgi:hypothetical protein